MYDTDKSCGEVIKRKNKYEFVKVKEITLLVVLG